MDPDQRDPTSPPPASRPAPAGRRRAVLAGAGVLVLMVAGWGLWWSYVAGQFRAGIEDWAARQADDGMTVAYGALTVDGFPFRLRAVAAEPAIARPEGRRPWSWQGPALTLETRPWRLGRLRAEAPGRHRLRATLADRARDFAIDVEALSLKLRLARGGVRRARLAVRGLAVDEAERAPVLRLAAAEAFVRRPGAAAAEGRRPGLDAMVEADDVALALEPIPGLSRTTARVRVEAAVTGGLPASASAAGLAEWRDGGGTIEVGRIALTHGPLGVTGDGTLALDQAMQPIGAFAVRVRGWAELLDQLAAAGVVKPRPAALAKAALGALARGQGGADGAVKVPLSVQDRRLYVGPVPLARLPAVRWE